jgi:hypothetical protein
MIVCDLNVEVNQFVSSGISILNRQGTVKNENSLAPSFRGLYGGRNRK